MNAFPELWNFECRKQESMPGKSSMLFAISLATKHEDLFPPISTAIMPMYVKKTSTKVCSLSYLCSQPDCQHLGKEVWLIENLWTDFGSNCLSFGTRWVEWVLGHSVQPETRCFSMALWRSAPHCKHGFLDTWSLCLYFVFVFIAKWPTAVIILSRNKWIIMYIHLRDWLNWLNLHMPWRASVMYPCILAGNDVSQEVATWSWCFSNWQACCA